MIHGHATPQGLFFPHAGVRISEDSATLISPEMIDRVLWPYIERSVEPFGGGFVHYCGKHDYLFQKLCSSRLVKAIDLGTRKSTMPGGCWNGVQKALQFFTAAFRQLMVRVGLNILSGWDFW